MILVKCTERDREALKTVEVDPENMDDNGAVYDGIKVKKPWGCEIENYRDDDLSIWWLKIYQDQQTSMHCHVNKTTMLFMQAGTATLLTLNGDYELKEGDLVLIEKGAFHQTKSNGVPVRLYELETPPNKRDLVRLQDAYGRGQGYERIEPAKVLFPENEGT